MAECHVKFIYKRNAFLIIFDAILRFWLKKSSFSTGFIRVSATRFWLLRNRVFRWFYKVLRRRGNALRKRCVAAGLLRNFGAISELAPKSIHFRQVL